MIFSPEWAYTIPELDWMKKIIRSNHWIHLMNLFKNLNRVFSVLQLIRSGDSRHHNVCIFDCEIVNSNELKWLQMNSNDEFK